MANIYIENITHTGNLPSANYTSTSCSWQYTIDSTTRGNSYVDLITIGKTYGTYKVGVLTFSNTGSTSLTVRVVNGSTTVSGSIYSGHGWSTYVNYNHQGDPDDDTDGQNWFYIDIPSSGPGGGGTLTVSWTALDTNNSRLASYTVDTTDFTYNGQTHNITLSSATGCSIVNTTYGTNAGAYQQTITATNGTTQFADCYYFIHSSTGEPTATSIKSWTISKADQDWVINPSTIYVDSSTVYAIVEDNWVGTLSCYVVDSSIATASVNSGSGVITINKVASSGTTIISVSSPGNSNMNARTQTATIIIGSPVTDKPVKIYVNGSWVNAIPYIYHNGSWTKATAYIYSGGQWKETKA